MIWERDDVLKLPLSAFFREGEDWAVFAVEDGVARIRTVERGRHTGLETQIREGLTPGGRVVRYPSDAVADGSRVTER